MPENAQAPKPLKENSTQPVDFDRAMNFRYEIKVPEVFKRLVKKLQFRKRDGNHKLEPTADTVLSPAEEAALQMDPLSLESTSAADRNEENKTTRNTQELIEKQRLEEKTKIEGIESTHELPTDFYDTDPNIKKYWQLLSFSQQLEQPTNGKPPEKGTFDPGLEQIEQTTKTIRAFYEVVFQEAQELGVEIDETVAQEAFEAGRHITAGVVGDKTRLVEDFLTRPDRKGKYLTQTGGYYGIGAALLHDFFTENNIDNREQQTIYALAYVSGAIANGAPENLVHHVRDWIVDIRCENRELGDFLRLDNANTRNRGSYHLDWATQGVGDPVLFRATYESSEIVEAYTKKVSRLLETNDMNLRTSREWQAYLKYKGNNNFDPTPENATYPPKFPELSPSLANEPLSARNLDSFTFAIQTAINYADYKKTALEGIADVALTEKDVNTIHTLLDNIYTRLTKNETTPLPSWSKLDRITNQSRLFQTMEQLKSKFPNEFDTQLQKIRDELSKPIAEIPS